MALHHYRPREVDTGAKLYEHYMDMIRVKGYQFSWGRTLPGTATKLYTTGKGMPIKVLYHDTAIVTVWADGTMQLRNGGYRTVTTKAKLCDYLPHGYGVYQKAGEWFLSIRHSHYGPDKDEFGYEEYHIDSEKVYEFQNYMVIWPGDVVEYLERKLSFEDIEKREEQLEGAIPKA